MENQTAPPAPQPVPEPEPQPQAPVPPVTPASPTPPAPANPQDIYPSVAPSPYSTPMPHPADAPAPQYQAPPQHTGPGAGTIILQWLTYAFWGWTVLAMSFLTVSVFESFIADNDTGSFTPYTIAAVLVLLPISLVCDHIYGKIETQKKTGASSVVMIIHAVIFALFGIGSLITAVFSLVTMFTSSSDSASTKAALFSALIICLLYGATFLRTLYPASMPKVRRYFTVFMLCVVGIISILGLLGPVAKARITRNDKLIQDNISVLSDSINNYATSNNRLPTDLKSLTLSANAQKLVDANLVDYKPNTKPPTLTTTYYSSTVTNPNKTYYYQLCVTYKKASKQKYPSYGGLDSADGYTNYVYPTSHSAGNTCYKVKTSY